MNKEITIEEAKQRLGVQDLETVKTKFLEFVESSNKPELLLKYKEYQGKREEDKVDVSKINFRVVAIKMIRIRSNQTRVAADLGVSPRTISREFAKLKSDEDKSLVNILDFYNDSIMKRRKFTKSEQLLIDKVLDNYEAKHPDLLVTGNKKTKEQEKEEQIIKLVSDEKKLKKQGLTQAQIAKELGVGISTLRRARIYLQNKKILLNQENDSNDENANPVTPSDNDAR